MDNRPVIIDAVIPTYHPQRRFLALLRMLARQELPVRNIHVINTDKGVWDAFLKTQGMDEGSLLHAYPNLDVEHITPEEFDHGATRNRGIRKCLQTDVPAGISADSDPDEINAVGSDPAGSRSPALKPGAASAGTMYALLLTQDALPKDAFLTRNLQQTFLLDPRIEAVYARQLANKNASVTERISREFNYPDEPQIKSQEDFSHLGIKTYFCSNVCAMYRLDVWQQLGGFPEHMIFNEDMVYAGRALQKGWKVAYAPSACVYHSHNYTALQQFHRNFDLGVSQADHPEIFATSSSEGEGVRYVRDVVQKLQERGAGREIPGFIVTCGCRYLGYRLGKNYRKLPSALVYDFSSNRHFWDASGQEKERHKHTP